MKVKYEYAQKLKLYGQLKTLIKSNHGKWNIQGFGFCHYFKNTL